MISFSISSSAVAEGRSFSHSYSAVVVLSRRGRLFVREELVTVTFLGGRSSTLAARRQVGRRRRRMVAVLLCNLSFRGGFFHIISVSNIHKPREQIQKIQWKVQDSKFPATKSAQFIILRICEIGLRNA